MGGALFKFPEREEEVTITYRASDVCARRRFWISSPGLDSPLQFMIDVKYSVPLHDLNQSNVPYLNLYTNDQQHPSEVSHCGTKELITKLEALNKKFEEALKAGKFDIKDKDGKKVRPTGRMIPVNDMSLPWGGTFKVRGEMEIKGQHGEHKWGNCVDLPNNHKEGITNKEFAWLKKHAPGVMGADYLKDAKHKNILHFNLTKRILNQEKE